MNGQADRAARAEPGGQRDDGQLRGAPEMSLREIYDSPEVRKIIQQSPQMWDFCKGCKIGCPYEVSSYRNSPFTAIRGGLDFLQLS